MMFYKNQHQFYAGIDLHARQMFVCIIDSDGNILFILGHALYMKAIHGGKTKNDKIDSSKIASMIRGGMFPMAYVYPRETRSVRDLLRRQYFVHHQSELLAHIQNTNTQYNSPVFEKKIAHQSNRAQINNRFKEDLLAKFGVDADSQLLDYYHHILLDIEQKIRKHAVHHDPNTYQLLRSVPGIGPILAPAILYEIQHIKRFPCVGNFISYSRLVKCPHGSAGKRVKGGHNKIGNSHLKWAFSEAAVLFLRNNPAGKELQQRLVSRYGKAKALSLIAQKLGRTVFYMLKRKEPFSPQKFYKDSVHAPVA